MVSEFGMPKDEDSKLEKYKFEWLYTNGLLGLIFTFGLLYTSLKSRKARSWRYGTGKKDLPSHALVMGHFCVKSKRGLKTLISWKGWYRSFIADYGVPLMVVVWTALSFSTPSKLPSGVPRRLFSPLPWDSTSLSHWTVIKVTIQTYYS